MIGEFVLIRSRGAGVFFGTLRQFTAGHVAIVELSGARRVHRWRGANSLSEMALRGIQHRGSRVSDAVERHVVIDIIEVLFPTPEARRSLEKATWSNAD